MNSDMYITIPISELLVNPSSRQSNKIRRRLLHEGLKKHICEHCLCVEWFGKPVPLELSHKDGNKHNNTLQNLELICPNCHAFTDTYRGKNVGNYS